uniref:AT2G30990 protein n=1 Tax=Arabidopsis thaliana TaxID=3702 RepID=B9DH03_ARATH|nr:AT2G30990 [Arabidopsis thaliana]
MLMGSLMMEEKQLDFNRPLISIRRPTQTSESESKTRSFDSVTNMIPPSPPVYKSDIKSGPVRNPGTVPFQWEHKPGKPKDERKPVLQSFVEPHFVPKLPPGRERVVELGRKPESTGANHQTKTVSSSDKYLVEDAKSNSSRYDDDDDDSDGTYLDATDTLSRTESFFFNCSAVSGASGLDGSGILVEPFGTLSTDRQTQDLMMGRFLPAAKALTSESPPHLARKPPKPEEPVKQLMKKKQNKVEQNPYRFRHSPDQEEEDGNISSMMASGVCGLLPQLCLRSSLGLLNPVPSVRMQQQRAVSVRRMRSKYQDSAPSNETHNKQNEDKRKLKLIESVAKGSSQGESLSVSSIPQGKEKLENVGTASRSKISKNFGELLASDENTWEPSSETPVAEKTLYVDIVHLVDKKVQEESKKQPILKESPSLDIVPVKDEEADISQPKSIEQENGNRDEDFTKFSSQKVEECPDHQAIVALPESDVVEITKEKKIDLEVQLQVITTNIESSRLHHRSSYLIVPPPPLPKAPSDSWLKRTLPTIPPKNNSFAWLQSLGTDDDNHFTKTQANPKWETMVKTSNTQQGFVCFSKETLNPIPES